MTDTNITDFPTWADRRAAVAKIVKAVVAMGAAEGWPLTKVEQAVYARTRGFQVEGRAMPVTYAEIERAVKGRITIGRCRNERHWGRKVAFWFPRGEQRLMDARCDACGGHLDQTTLALDTVFTRLRPQEVPA